MDPWNKINIGIEEKYISSTGKYKYKVVIFFESTTNKTRYICKRSNYMSFRRAAKKAVRISDQLYKKYGIPANLNLSTSRDCD